MSSDNNTPTPEEIERVGRYWQRVKDLVCNHETITYTYGEEPRCGGSCGRPVRILSDIQIEDLANRKGQQ